MTERLTTALHSAQFVREDLKAALNRATAVEALIILPMIGHAQEIVNQIEALISAKGATE